MNIELSGILCFAVACSCNEMFAVPITREQGEIVGKDALKILQFMTEEEQIAIAAFWDNHKLRGHEVTMCIGQVVSAPKEKSN